MNGNPQTEALLRGEIDVGFVYLPVHQPEVLTRIVLRKPLMVVLPEAHPLASLTTIPLSLLADQSFIIYPRVVKPDFYDLFITLCHQAGFQPKIVQETTPPYLILSLVAAGVGISLMGLRDEAPHNTGVVYREIAESESYFDLGAIWHKGRSVKIISDFLNVVQKFSN